MNNSSSRLNSSSAPKPKMKLKIKPFKKAPALPTDFTTTTLSKLTLCVHSITTQTPLLDPATSHPISREDLYRSVEDMCIHKHGALLYKTLEGLVREWVDGEVAKVLKSMPPVASELTLSNTIPSLTLINTLYTSHTAATRNLRSIFLYLDRSFVLQTPTHNGDKVLPITDMSLNFFRAAISPLIQTLTDYLLFLIQASRNGEAIPTDLVRSLLKMLTNTSLYSSAFHPPFIEATTKFFASEGVRLASSDSSAFLQHVVKRLKAANDSVNDYLDASSRNDLITCIEGSLVAPHVEAVLKRGFGQLMGGERQEILGVAFDLCKKVGKDDVLLNVVGSFVQNTVKEFLHDTSSNANTKGSEVANNTVQALLKLRDQIESVFTGPFKSDLAVKATIKSSFETALNLDGNAPAELLAKYVDGMLKQAKRTERETEIILEKVMVVFRYIHGKDVFEVFYKNALSKRLLTKKSASLDLERWFIAALKTECGTNYTAKIEGMMKDSEISEETVKAYHTWCADPTRKEKELVHPIDADGCKMELSVLTTGYWPQFTRLNDLILPAAIRTHQKRFDNFYTDKYQGRRVEWHHALGACTMDFHYGEGGKKKKILEVSQVMALVLVTMNKCEAPVPFKTLAEETGIATADLKLCLQALSLGVQKKDFTTRVLTRTREEKDQQIREDDTFSINNKFHHNMSKVKISSIQNKQEVAEEERKAHGSVMKDRMVTIDACVIRIMKTRKTLKHTELIEQTMAQLRHPAEAADIKKRIESLIEREYMERKDGERNVYNYLA